MFISDRLNSDSRRSIALNLFGHALFSGGRNFSRRLPTLRRLARRGRGFVFSRSATVAVCRNDHDRSFLDSCSRCASSRERAISDRFDWAEDLNIGFSRPQLSLIRIVRASERAVQFQILYRRRAPRSIFLAHHAHDVRFVLLHALVSLVAFDLAEQGVGLADAAHKMVAVAEPVDLPAGEDEHRGSVFDFVRDRENIKAVLGFPSAKNSLRDPFQLFTAWVLHMRYCIIYETPRKRQKARIYYTKREKTSFEKSIPRRVSLRF